MACPTCCPSCLPERGNDFRWYRPAMLRRRLGRRMALRQMDQIADYVALIQTSAEEVDALKGEFLIGVTDFFRDPEAWETLADEVLPVLVANRQPGDPPVRVWTPGCATGQESYSIAMLLVENCEALGTTPHVQIFGTDIDTDALAVARAGSYPESIASTISAQRLGRFFDRRGSRYVVRKQLRDCVMFAPQNLLRYIPYSRLDLVLCRNLLIYLEPALQERVLDLLHFAIRPGGYLLLGKAESAGPSKDHFEPASKAVRLFRRVGARSHLPGGLPSGNTLFGAKGIRWAAGESDRARPTHSEILRLHLGQRSVIAAILLDREGRPLPRFGRTCKKWPRQLSSTDGAAHACSEGPAQVPQQSRLQRSRCKAQNRLGPRSGRCELREVHLFPPRAGCRHRTAHSALVFGDRPVGAGSLKSWPWSAMSSEITRRNHR
ncbi:protein-glutamate O-methyltransferase CheR [Ramlibacter sp. AN1015]|uniref:CheR family methyltransferase n=1 Tax=Ramlibacter sp. AN1015 TaxID=3133428 RepID=UPI0030C118D8